MKMCWVGFFAFKEGSMETTPTTKIKEIEPRYYAQECPVCNGFGTLRHGEKVCQGCEGRGYIFVPTGSTEGSGYVQSRR